MRGNTKETGENKPATLLQKLRIWSLELINEPHFLYRLSDNKVGKEALLALGPDYQNKWRGTVLGKHKNLL